MKSHGVQGTLLQNVAVFSYFRLQWSFELERVLFCFEKWQSWTGLFGLLLPFPQKQSAGLRKSVPDFARKSMSPELGVPCLVIRGKELVKKGLAKFPVYQLILCPSLLVLLLFSVWWCILLKALRVVHGWVFIPYHIKPIAVLERRLPGYECSVCKYENPSSDAKHPHKMLIMSVCARDPSTERGLLRKSCLGFRCS